jgi:hypothetical protein
MTPAQAPIALSLFQRLRRRNRSRSFKSRRPTDQRFSCRAAGTSRSSNRPAVPKATTKLERAGARSTATVCYAATDRRPAGRGTRREATGGTFPRARKRLKGLMARPRAPRPTEEGPWLRGSTCRQREDPRSRRIRVCNRPVATPPLARHQCQLEETATPDSPIEADRESRHNGSGAQLRPTAPLRPSEHSC